MLTAELTTIKLRSGSLMYPVETWVETGRRYFRFPSYNAYLKDEIKAMEGARWSPETKSWHVADTHRNNFQLRYLMNQPVYAPFDAPLDESVVPRTRYNRRAGRDLELFKHQITGTAFAYQRHYGILAEEMGLGKTLQLIIAAELAMASYETTGEFWYVAPKSALYAAQRDFEIWGSRHTPRWFTYEAMTKEMRNWASGSKAPMILALDEFSRCKNATSLRSQAAKAIADGIRSDWGDQGYVIGATGTPSPKSPADWWSLAEIVCPGFLREGDIHKFKRRLAIIVQKEGIDGGSYPQLLAWRDNPKKCDICGQFADHSNHMLELLGVQAEVHPFKESKNEVSILAQRLKGLVLVYFKKDCLDLPDKFYRKIELKPSASILRAASLIAKTARSTIEGLTRLRELSDGFQYVEKKVGTQTCSVCKGAKEFVQQVEVEGTCPNCNEERVRDSKFDIRRCGKHTPKYNEALQLCPNCGGIGVVDQLERTVSEVSCPKDDALDDVLDEYSDVGRVVIYGGFTGTIDRTVKRCLHRGWFVIRMDQGSVRILTPTGEVLKGIDFQKMFQDDLVDYDKVAFVAHPKSGGMGLTLTASPVALYYSNDFDGEARTQSQDRIHRPGMDYARGATIIDLIHLPTDLKVIQNLEAKRNLELMSLGEFQEALESSEARPE